MEMCAYGLVLAPSTTRTYKKWSNSGDGARKKMAFALFKHLNCVRLGETSLYVYQTSVRRCRRHQLMETQTKRRGCDRNETEKKKNKHLVPCDSSDKCWQSGNMQKIETAAARAIARPTCTDLSNHHRNIHSKFEKLYER